VTLAVSSCETLTQARCVVSPVGVHPFVDTKVSRLPFQIASVIRLSIAEVTTSGPGCIGSGGSTSWVSTFAAARSNWAETVVVPATTEPAIRRYDGLSDASW
jgi:hypothetical protein